MKAWWLNVFLKNLKIFREDYEQEPIRDINFKVGLNIIADTTNDEDGNSIGKTTVLKIIDFCLGEELKTIFSDPENTKNIDTKVKAFLEQDKVKAQLTLKERLDDKFSRSVTITRSMWARGSIEINGEKIKSKEFNQKLGETIFRLELSKPSFRQFIAHNIRYKNFRIENTLKILEQGKTEQYEALHLFMLFGEIINEFYNSSEKSDMISELKELKKALKIALKGDNINKLEIESNLISENIKEIEEKIKIIKSNDNYEEDIDNISLLNSEIKSEVEKLNGFKLRKSLLEDNIKNLKSDIFLEEEKTLNFLYSEFTSIYDGEKLDKNFSELVTYHNKMNKNKINFFERDLPELNKKIEVSYEWIEKLQNELKFLEGKFKLTASHYEYNELNIQLNKAYENRGAVEQRLKEASYIENKIKELSSFNQEGGFDLYSEKFKSKLNAKIYEFNIFFKRISKELYGEDFYISFDEKEQNGVKFYEIKNHSLATSSGDKQGEALCFDIAFSLFADKFEIPHLRFFLNDKKELLDSNKINKAKTISEDAKIQLVFPMLNDKLLKNKNLEDDIVLELSKEEKFFKL